MLTIRKCQLSIAVFAMTAVALVPVAAHAGTPGDISLPQVLNTSPIWADTKSYQSCNFVNVSTGALNITVELISAAGAVLATSGSISLPAGLSTELALGAGYVGFARCRFTLNQSPGVILANLTAFHANGDGTYQIFAISEAR
jgi:hypothetical protein